jgi:hypothetical protein
VIANPGSSSPFIVGGNVIDDEENVRIFDFTKSRSSMQFGASSLDTEKSAKMLFTADKWTWTAGKQEESSRLLKTGLKW